MQKPVEVKNSNQKPNLKSIFRASLKSRGNKFIDGFIDDCCNGLKQFVRYQWMQFCDSEFDTSDQTK